jgi:3-isopropylmalate/(R)-2-methylmalate dehydratase large subunit
MQQTMIEKVIANHSEDEVRPGSIVWLGLDVRSARDFGGANVVKNLEKWYPGEGVDDVGKTFFTFDCVVPANNIPYANNQHICRMFARKEGIELNDVDAGIGTVVGTDSHLNIMGAIGAFGQGMGDQDIAFGFRTGKTWFEVPETMRLNYHGALPEGASAKDITLFTVGKLTTKGALGRSVEPYGQAIDKLSLAGRITLASMGTEMGAIILMIPPSQQIIDYCKQRSGKDFDAAHADEGASYCKSIDIDIDGLKPQIAQPYKPDNVTAVEDVDRDVDSVFIGSCTNGTYDDISRVARLVKGKKVHPRVMAKVVPATKEVYRRLLKEGHVETLFDAGFIISSPGCGGCASGQIGMTGEHEVQVSTSNRNFRGKQGKGDTYLAGPETAAASSILGKISSIYDLEGSA